MDKPRGSKTNNFVTAENLATLNSSNVNAANDYTQQVSGSGQIDQVKKVYDKNFADIKIKLGDKRQNKFDAERDSIPSDISENAWDELPKYNYFKYLEKQREDRLKNK